MVVISKECKEEGRPPIWNLDREVLKEGFQVQAVKGVKCCKKGVSVHIRKSPSRVKLRYIEEISMQRAEEGMSIYDRVQ